jgi:exodeoxyribonuclease VII small subunit
MSNFEERLKKLEELGDRIKQRDVSLEDALKCFEDGIKLARGMEKDLEKIEGKVQRLMNGDDADLEDEAEDADEDEEAEPGEKPAAKKRKKAEPSLELFEA